jgi:FKBP-type peptidyl-prolyl cis-trans isomerase SlyD
MEKIEPGKYVAIAYDLFDLASDGHETLMHQVGAEQPENFVYGVTPGVIVPLMGAIQGLTKGETFSVDVKPEEGFGEYNEEMLRTETLPRNIFERDGELNSDEIHAGAEIYLQTNVGQEVKAIILEVADSTVTVKVDFNHPMAGRTLRIKGSVIEVRPATEEEIAANQSHGCGCGCHDCGDDCGCGDEHHHHCGDDHCGCGNH